MQLTVVAVGYHVELSGRTLLALAPVFALVLALMGFALVDLVRAPSVRYLPKAVWAVVILLGSAPLGALAYLVLGRNRHGEGHDGQLPSHGRTSAASRQPLRHGSGLRL
jgi:hypothetical protein